MGWFLGMDSNSTARLATCCLSRLRKLALPQVAVYLVVLSVPPATQAATFFQLQHPAVTVVVEGSQADSKAAAETILQLQAAARMLLSWPDRYQEPPVLVFLVNEGLLRRVFHYPPDSPGAYIDATARHGTWARTASLLVVATAMGYERGRELRSLQRIYGEALLDAEPSHDWPECARNGMTQVFAAAELSPPNHFYLAGSKVAGAQNYWDPEEVLSPSNKPVAQWLTDERAYSCYLLSFMMASASQQDRAALARMLTSVGRGTPLGVATASQLGQSLSEFTAQFRNFADRLRLASDFHQVRFDLPVQNSSMPDASPVSSDQVKKLMLTLCSKLKNCRTT